MSGHVGFTGSRTEPSAEQINWLYSQLLALKAAGYIVFHHGDCVGSDALAHDVARSLGYWIIVHPPEQPRLRAWCKGDETREKKPYLIRNHDIVDESEMLVALPSGPEIKQSGTWATIRYANAQYLQVRICIPAEKLT